MRALRLVAPVLLFALLGSAPLPVPPAAPVPAGRQLHPAVRAVIDTKMEAHALEMTDLLMLMVLLERDDAAAAAERIASEPHIARARENTQASAGIPDSFFALQEQLSDRADAVAAAARRRDDRAMARAFGELTATCVACHSLYLEDRE